MSTETILLSEVIPATPRRIFDAWLDSSEHSAFTRSPASVVPAVGGTHTAWDGYAQGRTLELVDGMRIVQSWRTTEFPADSPDSRLEITLEPTLGGTLLTLLHTEIPSGQSDQYREGWNEYYLSRMKVYFAGTDAGDESSGDEQPSLTLEPPGTVSPSPSRATPAVSKTRGAKPAKRVAKTRASKSTSKRPKTAVKAVGRKAVKKASKKPSKKASKKPSKKPSKTASKKPSRQKVSKKSGRMGGRKNPRKKRR